MQYIRAETNNYCYSRYIKKEVDYILDITDKFNQSEYDKIYETIINNKEQFVIMGGDDSIRKVTILAHNYLYENLKIIIIDHNNNFISEQINEEQILSYGCIENNNIHTHCYALKKIKRINKSIIDNIKIIIDDDPIYISINAQIFNHLEETYVYDLLKKINSNIIGIDIVNYEPQIDKNILQECLIITCGLKEKKINIFTEDSFFLIYRPFEIDNDDDIGWFILRGLNNTEKEIFINSIQDKIMNIDIDGKTHLVTTTTMNEQNKITYFYAQNIYDKALYPQEKDAMVFELINN